MNNIDISSLPPKWVTYGTFIVVLAHGLVYAGTWIAAHGGLVGIYRAVMYGSGTKPPSA